MRPNGTLAEMMNGLRAKTGPMRWAAIAVLAALAAYTLGCGRGAREESRAPRTEDVTVRILSQSCFWGEVVPCG